MFLEASYFGCNQDVKPIVLIGKGVTFDSGGLCLKVRIGCGKPVIDNVIVHNVKKNLVDLDGKNS